ncbi:MAG: menaquinone-dependent protoporphyrinogen IX dehydrogenase [Sulfuricaulis sp.]|uniref:menaquinone-dependent protoporphyrinogen IX dehydrogenase n=1 Tax=Sulfuricaulis sp. TaxID=2003553 RepID=UPI0025DA4DC2|nr:menaquinone-dependent protoporphyrinogen IX dehydrogenase [Sulfuricaulis sp.]MCR4347863.1 menaquinone-dependent protoporphyrinogen IX dehydrogenase [Sulfuricaulis sp.]
MASILIIYSTTDGHTLKICQRLQQVIEREHHRVELVPVSEADSAELNRFDKIVIGASIRYGKHRPEVFDFIERNRKVLDSKPGAFFTVNVVARKLEKNRPETNPYVKKFHKKSSWQPRQLAVFAGKIDYQKYCFWDRQIIRLIMWMTKGPTDLKTVAEFTNWEEVEVFGRRICMME